MGCDSTKMHRSSPVLEAAFVLNGAEQLQVVEVPLSEVPADDDARHHLAIQILVLVDIVDRLWKQGLQAASVQVHRPEREDLGERGRERILFEHPFELRAEAAARPS